jgi:hypothetical protein
MPRPRTFRSIRTLVSLAASVALTCTAGAQQRPRPVGPTLDDCTYETCVPRIQSWRNRLVLGPPESAIVLSGAAGDSLLRRTRTVDLLLERRDVAGRSASRRQLVALGAFAATIVGTVVAIRREQPALGLLVLGVGAGTSFWLATSSVGPALDAEGTWNEAVLRHRDASAEAILARRGLTARDVASSTEALAECTWASCALTARSGFLTDRLVVGGATDVSLGFSGDGLARRVRAVPAALPAARRYASAKGIANVLGVGTLLYTLVARPVGTWENVALMGGGAVTAWQGLRARHALEEAVWRYNRELLR